MGIFGVTWPDRECHGALLWVLGLLGLPPWIHTLKHWKPLGQEPTYFGSPYGPFTSSPGESLNFLFMLLVFPSCFASRTRRQKINSHTLPDGRGAWNHQPYPSQREGCMKSTAIPFPTGGVHEINSLLWQVPFFLSKTWNVFRIYRKTPITNTNWNSILQIREVLSLGTAVLELNGTAITFPRGVALSLSGVSVPWWGIPAL